MKAPQEQHLEIESPNKNHKDFDPEKAQEKLDEILKDGKLKDVLSGPQKKSELMSIYINNVEKMIPKKQYSLDELKMWLKVPLDCDLKRVIKFPDGREEVSDVLQGNMIIAIRNDRLFSVVNNK